MCGTQLFFAERYYLSVDMTKPPALLRHCLVLSQIHRAVVFQFLGKILYERHLLFRIQEGYYITKYNYVHIGDIILVIAVVVFKQNHFPNRFAESP